MIDLSPFCGSFVDDKFASPFGVGDFTYATDGHIIARVPFVVGTEREPPVKIDGLQFSPAHEGTWQQIPDYEPPELRQCPQCQGHKKCAACEDCHGQGEVSFSIGRHEYECECKECDGTGFVPGGETPCDCCHAVGSVYKDHHAGLILEGAKLSLKLLDKIKSLPEAQIFLPALNPAKGWVHFRFDGGVGFAMVMMQ